MLYGYFVGRRNFARNGIGQISGDAAKSPATGIHTDCWVLHPCYRKTNTRRGPNFAL